MNVGGGSKWNDLIYRVHTDVPTSDGTDSQPANRHGGPQVGANWASFSNAELNISGNGRACWAQETSEMHSPLALPVAATWRTSLALPRRLRVASLI